MIRQLSFSQFRARFPSDELCLDEIKKLRYPKGIHCPICKEVTKHYKINKRAAYACTTCRHQVYPLAHTIFAKTSTPLRVWFYALFLMTQTRATIPITNLQKELGVTYKTAWRMYKQIRILMEQNEGDLLDGTFGIDDDDEIQTNSMHRWVFFNKIEFKVVQKQKVSG